MAFFIDTPRECRTRSAQPGKLQVALRLDALGHERDVGDAALADAVDERAAPDDSPALGGVQPPRRSAASDAPEAVLWAGRGDQADLAARREHREHLRRRLL